MKKDDGFTLLEILVVLVILGLLASLVGPRLFNQLSASKVKTAALQIEGIASGLDLYRLEVGQYPTTAQGLKALVTAPSGVSGWNGPYLKKSIVRQDPWGHDYYYKSPGQHGEFDLYTLGADNRPGGEGEDQDVGNWN